MLFCLIYTSDFYIIFIGKLQVLDRLLRQLKAGHHRVLIFTQMTRMLDVLEAFLNFHGHIYLRLDGTTRIDQRQVCWH
jgi:E1A-binding protein p400